MIPSNEINFILIANPSTVTHDHQETCEKDGTAERQFEAGGGEGVMMGGGGRAGDRLDGLPSITHTTSGGVQEMGEGEVPDAKTWP